MEPYKPHLFYKLYRALQDEGFPDDEIVFENNPTFVSDLGFFTLRFDQKIPWVVHFLVWKDKRSWHNSVKVYRELKNVLIGFGFVRFIATLPKDKIFYREVFQFLSGKRKIEPYAVQGMNTFYVIRFGRKIR